MTRASELLRCYQEQAQAAANVAEGQGPGAILGLADFVMEEILILEELKTTGEEL